MSVLIVSDCICKEISVSAPEDGEIIMPKQLTAMKKSKKDKAVPLQAWSGPEGSRKLMFPDYETI